MPKFTKKQWEDYRGLIQQVEKLDKKAARYLKCNAIHIKGFNPQAELLEVMFWSSTKQGVDYWADLAMQLKEIRGRRLKKEGE